MKSGKIIGTSLFAISLLACNPRTENKSSNSDTAQKQQSIDTNKITSSPGSVAQTKPQTYSNQRFKDVTVEKIADNKYIIRGKAQVFEANFSWVVEDGHNEIMKGHNMTDAGGPAWGKFIFSIEVKKQRTNSTLTLILFEISAKDGSRQHELPVPLG